MLCNKQQGSRPHHESLRNPFNYSLGHLQVATISEVEEEGGSPSKMGVSSCCGISLEKGCKIIAILGLVLGAIGVIPVTWSTYSSDPEMHGVFHLVFHRHSYEISIVKWISMVSSAMAIVSGGLLLWGAL